MSALLNSVVTAITTEVTALMAGDFGGMIIFFVAISVLGTLLAIVLKYIKR